MIYVFKIIAHSTPLQSSSDDDPYIKNTECKTRTFTFENCTLCFCTDQRNVAACWDYEGNACEEMKQQVNEQKNKINNNPNGIW
ncbi:hypothetical protein TSAR_010201 [Trichomalopsis sarcophagae]|uniref:Pacifastin domain-containing protein n=1 Tax=Trichomalopsis sarcophagae TaxID=543379 RepID=A0A232F034_9HYME|nr:hypothetical protein TSAR_010201 [Trichomalopsis sarcophagae]